MRESHGSDPRRSILHHSGKTALQASVFASADFDVKDRHEFLFRTRDAVKLATAVEFYIEKFMSIAPAASEKQHVLTNKAGVPATAND